MTLNNNNEIDDSLFLNTTYLNDTFEVPAKLNVSVLEENSRLSHLSWTHPENIRDAEKELEIGRIVIKCFNLMEFSDIAMNYRAKILETLKNFHKSYLNDVREYCERIVRLDPKNNGSTNIISNDGNGPTSNNTSISANGNNNSLSTAVESMTISGQNS